jgi:hypothetical protein
VHFPSKLKRFNPFLRLPYVNLFWYALIVFSVFLLASSPYFSQAAFTEKFNYQGKLYSSGGGTVPDGNYDLVFRLYADPLTTTPVWTSTSSFGILFTDSGTTIAVGSATCGGAGNDLITYTSNTNETTLQAGQTLWNVSRKESAIVKSINTGTNQLCVYHPYTNWSNGETVTNRIYVKNGLFSTMLGDFNALSGVDFNQPLYLGVTVGSDSEMKPRRAIGTVPSALNTKSLNGLTWDNPGTIGSTTRAAAFFSQLAIGTSTYGGSMLTIQGTSTNALLNIMASTSVSALYVGSGGNIGIGTTTPQNRLHITTPAEGHGLTFSNGSIIGSLSRETVDSVVGIGLEGGYGRPVSINGISSSSVLIAAGGGNVGIGTTSPMQKLSLVGNAFMNGNATTTGTQYAAYFQGNGSGLTNLDAADISAGTLVVSRGGTGVTTLTGIAIGNGTSAFVGSSTLSDNFITDGLTVSGGTLGSNNVSSGAAWTTLGALTIGDGGDTITMNASNWDVTNTGAATFVGVNAGAGLIQGTAGLTVTGNTSLAAASTTALTVTGNTILNTLTTTGAAALSSLTLTTDLSAANGGTGTSTAGPAGSVIYSNGSAHVYTAAGTNGQILRSNAAGMPTWVSTTSLGIDLSTIAGTLGVAKGGTGATTLTGVIKGNGTGAMTAMTGTTNYLTKWTDANTLGTSTIYDNGTSVGIGISTPSGVLDLGGSTSGRALSWGGTANNYANIWTAYSSGALMLGSGLRGSTTADAFESSYGGNYGRSAIRMNLDGTLRFYTQAASTVADGLFINPSERMIVNSSGNIGIGTTTPSGTLHVNSAGTTLLNVDAPAASMANIQFMSAGASKMGLFRPANTGDLRLDSNAVSNIMYWTNSGNVGIGTANPSHTLQVYDAASSSALFNGYSTVSSLANVGNGSILIGNNPAYQGIIDYNQSASTVMTIKNSYSNASSLMNFDMANIHVLSLLGDGRVGIGTTAPSMMLTVGSNNNFTVSSAGAVAANSLTLATDLAAAHGGTGTSTAGAAGSVIYSNGTAHVYTGAGTTGQILWSNAAAKPTWVSTTSLGIDLSTITGTLDVNSGGTGVTTLTGIAIGNGTNAFVGSSTLSDNFITDGLTVSGGTLGSNNISSGATWTTLGALTIGDGGDTITMNASNWDVTNTGAATFVGVNAGAGLIQGTAGLTITGNTSLAAASTTALTVSGNTVMSTVAVNSTATFNSKPIFNEPMVEGDTTYRVYHNLASYNSSAASATGTFAILTNIIATSPMMGSVDIDGYFYDATAPFKMTIGFYRYGTAFTNYGYINTGANKLPVFLATTTGDKVVILLGTTTAVYPYPKISVTQFTQGHTSANLQTQADGWTISQVTTTTAYSALVSVPDKTTISGSISNANIGSATISSGSLWTTAGTLTIGDNGDNIIISANNWDISSAGAATFTGVNSGAGLIQGTAGLTITGNTSLAAASTTALTVSGNTILNTLTVSGAAALSSLTLTTDLAAAHGGTGTSTAGTAGSVIYSNGTAHVYTAAGANGQILRSNAAGMPTWVSTTSLGIDLSTIAGTLGVAKGGTGATSLTGFVIGNGTNALTSVASSSAGLASIVNDETGSGALVFNSGPTVSSLTVSSGGATITGNSSVTGTFSASATSSLGGILYVNSVSGDIGIGTSTPSNSESWDRTLDVYGVSHSKILASTNGIETALWSHNSGIYGAPAGGLVGTKSGHPFSIVTSGAVRMTVGSTGNVGIGATSPVEKLDVRGNIFVGNTDYINNTTGSFLRFKLGAASGNTYSAIDSFVDGGYTGGKLVLNSAGAGNVGIGTNNPTLARLQVNGSIAIDGTNGLYGYNGTGIHLYSLTPQGPGDLSISGYAGVGITGGKTGGPETSSYGLFVTSANNVGIGTTSPIAKLDVRATAISGSENIATFGLSDMTANQTSGDYLSIINSTTSNSVFHPTIKGGSGDWADPSLTLWADKYWSDASAGTMMKFISSYQGGKVGFSNLFQWGEGAASSYTPLMTMNEGGYLGIGTTSPQARLNVFTNQSSQYAGLVQNQHINGYGLKIDTGANNTTAIPLSVNRYDTTNLMYVRGDGYGYLLASAWAYGSDRRLKENISYLNNGLSVIEQLRPAKFDYINGQKEQLGFIAQDVAMVIPEAVTVSDPETGMLSLKSDFIIPYLVNAIKEQQAEIDDISYQVGIISTTSKIEIINPATSSKTAILVKQENSNEDIASFQNANVEVMNVSSAGVVKVVGTLSVDGRTLACAGACPPALTDKVDETRGDMGAEGKMVAGAFEKYCEEGYVWVNGSAKYGTMPGFCVMQDLAREDPVNGGQLQVTSHASLATSPWVDISQGDSQSACQGLGGNAHLLSENEWLTMAEQIIKNRVNDTDASTTGLQLGATSTHYLANGQAVYDLVGAASTEWTDMNIAKGGLPAFTVGTNADSWQDYDKIEDYKGLDIMPPYYLNSTNSIGQILLGSGADNIRGFVRGYNGIFSLDVSNPPTAAKADVSFRCAK